ncbi:helix-turn-helix domain-containing protein [Moraxella sp. ZY210820]|uniref:helix-turn-helix domain-containing protein n=1 Tax=unclassified Moraxella TaxID=2685852 RepID=UPI00273055A8|nr:helix-turn-helix domain-containing protein [Moraxella sp. ZY210820]WLF84081.1 hypothetical protein LU301_00785 [Moraxella sp. ZY210820]
MQHYKHLTQEQRYHISTLLKSKVSLSQIAKGYSLEKIVIESSRFRTAPNFILM